MSQPQRPTPASRLVPRVQDARCSKHEEKAPPSFTNSSPDSNLATHSEVAVTWSRRQDKVSNSKEALLGVLVFMASKAKFHT